MRKFFSKRFVFFFTGLTLAALVAFAEGTRQWRQTTYEEFERGTARGVAIRSNGQLELAPAFKAIYTSPSTFIWSIAADKDGTVYAATGAPARVYRITPDGKSTVIFEPKELQVQAIALGKDGAVYAATSPDGKVYRLTRKPSASGTTAGPGTPAGEFAAETFFEPKTKYIWDLELDAEGQLYIATGDGGQIFRVDKTGKGAPFFKSDEANIRVLSFDAKGNVIAGSDGSALIYRITPAGEGFVLYSAPRKEITALAVDSAGNIYAAGTGEKRAAQATPAPSPAPPILGVPQPSTPFAGTVNLGGSDIYMIAPDGMPRKLWSSRDDVVYALSFDAAGRLIAGTGNKGRIFAVEKDGQFVDLVKASASQVTAFRGAPGGGLYCSTSNLGKVFLLSNSTESEGSFESDVYDARIFSRWGRAEVRGHGNYELFARSGNVDNPDRNWSSWMRVDLNKDARLDVPPARFVQWRVVLKPSNPGTLVDDVTINYLSKNVAPVVDEVAVQPGARYQSQPRTVSESATVNVGAVPAVPVRVDVPATSTRDRGSVAVRWSAHDDNDDNLVYSVYYRGDNEKDWKLLTSGLADKFYSFDSTLLPDGGYTIKIVASDSPSHTPEEALSDEKESQRFEIDNTPPRIEGLAARLDGQQIHVTFHAVDDFSPIRRAEYSLDAGDWQFLEPVGQLSDSRTLNYDFNVPLPSAAAALDKTDRRGKVKSPAASTSEHVVVVRVYDRYDNVGTAKSVVR